jgi:hypothetical protein
MAKMPDFDSDRRAERSRQHAAFSRRDAPEVCQGVLRPIQRAQGRPGARCTRGLACKIVQKKRTRAYRFSGNTPAFPAQWLYGLWRARPGVSGFHASVAPRKPARRPGRAFRASARLDADHRGVRPTRFCRTLKCRSSARRPVAHGVDPAPPPPARPTSSRPPRPRPTFRDGHDTPL